MRKIRLENKELDSIGRQLIESGCMLPDEIDQIISNPRLFGRIMAQVPVEEGTPNPIPRSYRRFDLRTAVVFAGIVVVLFSSIVVLSRLRSETPKAVVVNEIKAPAELPVAARPDLPPQQVGNKLSPGRAQIREMQTTPVTARYEPRQKVASNVKRQTEAPQDDFYAVSYAGDLNDTPGGRIIRVEMPRASLLAMGINVPLENESGVVSADLLVGADGVTRAIRVIK